MSEPLHSRHITDSRELAERARPARNKPGLHRIFSTTHIRRPIPEVYAFFSDPNNLAVLTPPELELGLLDASESDDSDLIRGRITIRGIPFKWRLRTLGRDPNTGFSRAQEKGPFSVWHHTHTFTDEGDRVRVDEEVIYRLPLWPLGEIAAPWTARELERLFAFRRRRLHDIFGED